jgi:hypothetical protein
MPQLQAGVRRVRSSMRWGVCIVGVLVGEVGEVVL